MVTTTKSTATSRSTAPSRNATHPRKAAASSAKATTARGKSKGKYSDPVLDRWVRENDEYAFFMYVRKHGRVHVRFNT